MQFAQFISWISHCMAQVSVCARHSIFMSIHDERLIVRSVLLLRSVFLLFLSLLFTSSLLYLTCSLNCTPSSMWTAPRETPAALSPNEEYCPRAMYNPPTGYEPNVLDDFHYSETSAMIFQEESSDIDTEPSYLCDAELDDETIGKALSSPLFIQEREEPADRRQSLSLSWRKFVASSVLFRTHKKGETRTRTYSVSKTKIKSRLRKRANQDYPWTTKRANSRWL